MAKTPIEIMEEATAQVARNLFKLKYPEASELDAPKLVQDCVNDTVFIINNFMRISSEIARQDVESVQENN